MKGVGILLVLFCAPAAAFAQGVDVLTGGQVTIAGGGRVEIANGGYLNDAATVDLTSNTSELYVAGNLTITLTGALTVAGVTTPTIRVGGNWSDVGAWTPGNSTAIFDGSGAQTIDKVVGVVTADQTETFYNLTVSKTGGTLTTFDSGADSGDRIHTTGNLTLAAGTLDLDPDNTAQIEHQVDGNFIQSGGTLQIDSTGNEDTVADNLLVLGNISITGGTYSSGITTGEINLKGNFTESSGYKYHGILRMRNADANGGAIDTRTISMTAAGRIREISVWQQENGDIVEAAAGTTMTVERVQIERGVLRAPAGTTLTIVDIADPGFTTVASAILLRYANNYSALASTKELRMDGGTFNSPKLHDNLAGSGTVTVNSGTMNLSATGTGCFGFSFISDSGAAVVTQSGGTINVAGDWDFNDTSGNGNSNTFTASGGTVVMNGSGTQNIRHNPSNAVGGLWNLTVNNTAASDSANPVNLLMDATVRSMLTVTDGRLKIDGTASAITLTLDGSPVTHSVAAAGVVNLIAGASLLIGASSPLTVVGTLACSTSTAAKPTISRIPAGTTIDVNVTGTADITALKFSYGDTEGLNFNGATFTNLSGVIFSNLAAGATARFMSVTAASLALYSRDMYFDAGPVAGGPYNVYAVDSNGGDDVRVTFENRGTAIHGLGVGEAFDFDADTNDDGFYTPAPTYPAPNDAPNAANSAIVNWVWAIGLTGGFPQGAVDMSSFLWYATYLSTKNASGYSYVMRADGNGVVTYAYSFLESTYGAIVGPIWWDNAAGVKWLYFGTSSGYLFRLDDTGAALTLTAGWPVNMNGFSPPCVEVTSPAMSDGTRIYFGGREDAVPTYRMFAVAAGAAPPAGWAWSPNPTVATAVRSMPGFMYTSGTYLFATCDVIAGAAHAYKITASSGVISQNNTTNKQHDMKAPVTISGISAANMRLVVGDYGGRLQMMDADSSTMSDYAGWPYLCSPHALGDPNAAIRASALFDSVQEYSYFGDSDGHIYVVTELAGDYDPPLPGTAPAFPRFFEPAVAIESAPYYNAGLIYIGNNNGKMFVTDRSDDNATAWVTLKAGPGVAIGDVSWMNPGGTPKIMFSGSNGKTYLIAPYTDPTATP